MGDSSAANKISTIKSAHHLGESINGVNINDLYLSYLRIEIDS